MIDVIALIKTNLDTTWSTGIPRVGRDEVNPMTPYPQVILAEDNMDQTTIRGTAKRIDHGIKISVFVKPTTFTELAVFSGSQIMMRYKNTIDTNLLTAKRTLIGGSGSMVSLGVWKDIQPINRGTNMRENNGTFESEQVINVRYYQG